MGNEDEEGWRSPPLQPYVPGLARLIVPREAVNATFDLLTAAGRLESCVFWYGRREGQQSSVTAVRAPMQDSRRGNYHVDETAFSAMVATISDDLRPLAQIHSHPGRDVEHSLYDDEMISSRRALSLVFPFYGSDPTAWLSGIGVHEWQDDYWHLLQTEVAERRISLGSGDVSIMDLRT
jgi:hypothetical protein